MLERPHPLGYILPELVHLDMPDACLTVFHQVLLHQPSKDILISLYLALLEGHVVRVIRLLVELSQAVGGLGECVLQSLEVLLSAKGGSDTLGL